VCIISLLLPMLLYSNAAIIEVRCFATGYTKFGLEHLGRGLRVALIASPPLSLPLSLSLSLSLSLFLCLSSSSVIVRAHRRIR